MCRRLDVPRDSRVEYPLMFGGDIAFGPVKRRRIAAVTFRLLVQLRADLEELG